MCGILGFHLQAESHLERKFIDGLVRKLYVLSESRGKEASGIALQVGDWSSIERSPQPASRLIRSEAYRELMAEGHRRIATRDSHDTALQFLGHSRLVTNGIETRDCNNQPVERTNTVGIHNGIIVNADDIWNKHHQLLRSTELDSESFFALVESSISLGRTTVESLKVSFGEIEGMASVGGFIKKDRSFFIATNNGSIYYIKAELDGKHAVVFASERFIIERIEKYCRAALRGWSVSVLQLRAGEALVIGPNNRVELESIPKPKKGEKGRMPVKHFDFANRYKKFDVQIPELKRCTRCVLPETHPFIRFDEAGICNFCRDYKTVLKSDDDALKAIADRYRSKDGSPDCVVAFSGGRDSCYGLHYLKKELKMNPIAFTYDWGMVTDLARRNQSRLCGLLGVEHIMISADIRKKRENIRKNVTAWLRKPDLGMIPLFMAGDKQFFQHANLLKTRMGIDLVVFASCPLETTQFKIGFTGIGNEGGEFYYKWGPWQKSKIGVYYAKQYLSNPGYLNGSLYDSIEAFLAYFFIKHNYLWLFESIQWDEETVERVLLEEYDWETSPDCDSTWRIGDGTAAFYNYIYYRVAGFTENDTFRSNQIREGQITRDKAMQLVQKDNTPRIDSLQWYADTIGFDLSKAVDVINEIPRLY